jgi:exopolyphosphatase
MQNGTLLAAIDLGSNSFRLEIGRYHSGHIERIEYLKETVRQGNGLDEEKNLSQAAMERGWECLARFAERLHGFKRQQVRAVATQTLREAKNRDEFVRQAQTILGFPIDVVSGYEEARLIYQGVSRLLPHSDEKRLVVDIGGRSTEMILGQGYSARTMESYRLGSVAWSTRYFPRGQLTAAAFKTAEVAAKAVIDEALDKFPPADWTVAYGSSGTVGAVADMLAANGWASGVVTRSGLDWLTDRMIKSGNVDQLRLEGLKDDRRPVIGGGVSVLRAIFDLFGIEQMLPAQGALRHGALYDLIDRDTDGGDVRERTVSWLTHRFSADEAQGCAPARDRHPHFPRTFAPPRRLHPGQRGRPRLFVARIAPHEPAGSGSARQAAQARRSFAGRIVRQTAHGPAPGGAAVPRAPDARARVGQAELQATHLQAGNQPGVGQALPAVGVVAGRRGGGLAEIGMEVHRRHPLTDGACEALRHAFVTVLSQPYKRFIRFILPSFLPFNGVHPWPVRTTRSPSSCGTASPSPRQNLPRLRR